jgi:hypothetical protein
MSDITADEAKTIYEVSKLTSSTKLIMDDFLTGIALAMFKDYIASFKHYEVALHTYMDEWESNILKEKQEEIEMLENQQNSLSDMVVGSALASTENLDDFKKEVSLIKNTLLYSITTSIQDSDNN